MISRAISRSLPRQSLRPSCRQFSSSRQRLAEAQAAQIKKLGVIGAGQMVCEILMHARFSLTNCHIRDSE